MPWDLFPNVRTVLATVAVYLLAKTAIQWWRSRLRNLPPGPIGFPIVGAVPYILLSSVSPQETFRRWSQIYGKILSLRVGNRIFVVLNDFDMINEALHHPDLQNRPTQTIEALQKSTGSSHGVTTANGQAWKDQRRFMHNVLRELGVNKTLFEEHIQSEVTTITGEIDLLKGKPFDPQELLTCPVSNIICGVAFHKRYNYESLEFKHLLSIVSTMSGFPISASAIGTVPALRHLPFGPHVKFIQCFKEFHEILDNLISDRKTLGVVDSGTVNCMIDAYLLEVEKTKLGRGTLTDFMKRSTIHANIGALFFAGSDTTVTTLVWALLFFTLYPDVQVKCHEEIDRVIGQDRPLHLADRPNLPYLEATIAEVQRMGDIAPVGVPHSARCDVQFHGYTIPKKAMIIPNIHAVMFDEHLWDNPYSFQPERFLNKEGQFVKSPKLIPFGTGPRKCLGEQVAQMQIFLFLSSLLQRFTFLLPNGAPKPTLEGTTGVTFKPLPFQVRAEPRAVVT